VSNWARTPTPRSGGGGLFIRLEDGQHVDFVPLSDVRVRFKSWNQAERRYDEASGPGRGVSTEYVACVWDCDEKSQRIASFNALTFEDVKSEISDASGDSRQVFRLRRKGAGKDTRYTVKVLGQRHEEAVAIIAREGTGSLDIQGIDPATVDWHASTGGINPMPPAEAESASEGADEEIPF